MPLQHQQIWLADAHGYRKQYGGKLMYRLVGVNGYFKVANEFIAIIFHCIALYRKPVINTLIYVNDLVLIS